MTQIARAPDWRKTISDEKLKNFGKKCVFDGCEIDRLNSSEFCYLHGEEHSTTARIPQVYFMLCEEKQEFKIGTSIDVGRRFEQIQAQCDGRLALISMVAGSYSLESKLHYCVREHRTHGEWFSCTGKAKELLDIAAKKGRVGVEAFIVLYGDA